MMSNDNIETITELDKPQIEVFEDEEELSDYKNKKDEIKPQKLEEKDYIELLKMIDNAKNYEFPTEEIKEKELKEKEKKVKEIVDEIFTGNKNNNKNNNDLNWEEGNIELKKNEKRDSGNNELFQEGRTNQLFQNESTHYVKGRPEQLQSILLNNQKELFKGKLLKLLQNSQSPEFFNQNYETNNNININIQNQLYNQTITYPPLQLYQKQHLNKKLLQLISNNNTQPQLFQEDNKNNEKCEFNQPTENFGIKDLKKENLHFELNQKILDQEYNIKNQPQTPTFSISRLLTSNDPFYDKPLSSFLLDEEEIEQQLSFKNQQVNEIQSIASPLQSISLYQMQQHEMIYEINEDNAPFLKGIKRLFTIEYNQKCSCVLILNENTWKLILEKPKQFSVNLKIYYKQTHLDFLYDSTDFDLSLNDHSFENHEIQRKEKSHSPFEQLSIQKPIDITNFILDYSGLCFCHPGASGFLTIDIMETRSIKQLEPFERIFNKKSKVYYIINNISSNNDNSNNNNKKVTKGIVKSIQSNKKFKNIY
ncbi:hypothetical protein RB653_005708 [Dictyostelium firmibasis]|uniref:Uncharacterized protein n=1 Tax=Dictyostelium firmibasis TaxID=79012 RepID=A0AAN7YYF0_9MYCE